jgi:hypothetical protein
VLLPSIASIAKIAPLSADKRRPTVYTRRRSDHSGSADGRAHNGAIIHCPDGGHLITESVATTDSHLLRTAQHPFRYRVKRVHSSPDGELAPPPPLSWTKR